MLKVLVQIIGILNWCLTWDNYILCNFVRDKNNKSYKFTAILFYLMRRSPIVFCRLQTTRPTWHFSITYNKITITNCTQMAFKFINNYYASRKSPFTKHLNHNYSRYVHGKTCIIQILAKFLGESLQAISTVLYESTWTDEHSHLLGDHTRTTRFYSYLTDW